ncbi:uncharacterized protein LOC122071218 [Macadamia integrifolia]|uniref:uncharacterized protein LOC122071218 n=1 Tax=Macadamia integrifolia TaxID=60698 RepID=UPI001C4FC903|nr:uncharacterized protein LOC122071218 [Macadamia integrifolia]
MADVITCGEREVKNKGKDVVINVTVMESIEKDCKKVRGLPSNCSMYRVPKPQFKRKSEAYVPRLVSIGPFHHDKKHLKPMETHKLRYLNDFLFRSKSRATLNDYVEAMKILEESTRQCYSEIFQHSKEEFVKMMVIDGCFILELILKTIHNGDPDDLDAPDEPDDPIMNAKWMLHAIKYDLILLENQLPFFKRFKGNSNGLDITVEKGVLKIPTITIEDRTESLLRNLIAFEQSRIDYENYITDYAFFLDGLINSPTDVELLEKKGIIGNLLGEPTDVAALFNGLLKEVTLGTDSFHTVHLKLEKHYKNPWLQSKAILRQKYFNSRWASISIGAASLLLILTVVQTVCSILQVT